MRKSHRGFTLVELLVVIAIIGLLVSLALPAVQAARESARSSQCKNNLRNLALAVQKFSDRHGSMPTYDGAFPPNKPDGTPSSSQQVTAGWFVHLLPDLDQQVLFDRIQSPSGDDATRIVVGQTSETVWIPPSPDYKPAHYERGDVKNMSYGELRALFWVSGTVTYVAPTGCSYTPPPDPSRWSSPIDYENDTAQPGSPHIGYYINVPGYYEYTDGYQETTEGIGYVGGIWTEDEIEYHDPTKIWHPPTHTFHITQYASWHCDDYGVDTCDADTPGGGGVPGSHYNSSNCGRWKDNIGPTYVPQQGTPGWYKTITSGGTEIFQPKAVNVAFDVLTCYSDPSDTRPFVSKFSPAMSDPPNYQQVDGTWKNQGGVGQGYWSLTNYLANFQAWTSQNRIVGPQGARWEYEPGSEQRPSKMITIRDGLSNTILFAEAMRDCGGVNRFAFWSMTQPHYLYHPGEKYAYKANSPDTHNFGVGFGPVGQPDLIPLNTNMFQSYANNRYCSLFYVQAMHGSSINVAMCDGSVKSIKSDISHRQVNDPDKPGFGLAGLAAFGYFNGTWDMLMLPNDGQIITEQWAAD